MSYEADKIYRISADPTLEESELERDKYAASLAVARAWLQIQANRRGSLLFTSELRKAAEIALEIIANPELCLKAHDDAHDKEKDYQIRQRGNVLAEAARELLRYYGRYGGSGRSNAFEIARMLGYDRGDGLDDFLSSVSVSEPNA